MTEGVGGALQGIASIISAVKKPKKEKVEVEVSGNKPIAEAVGKRMGGNPLHYQTHVKQPKSKGKRSSKSTLHYRGK